MFRVLRAPLTAVMLSSVALVPAATIAFVASTDVALAKSSKSRGNGAGKSSGQKSQSPGKSRGQSGSGKSAGKPNGKDSGSSDAKSRPKDDPMHASNLGNMNGALHANENAIAAHIRNGNTNGPVGLMAAYVTARAITQNATDALGEDAGNYIELNNLLVENGYVDDEGNPDLLAYTETGELDPVLEAALNRISWSEQDRILVENGFVDLGGNPDFQAYVSYRDAGETIQEIEDASTEPGGFDEALYASVKEVSGDLTADEDAAQALVDYWNKNNPDFEEAFRAALETRAIELETSGVVAETLPEPDIEDVVACEPDELECGAEEELALATE